MKQIISDSGGTKTDWCIVDEVGTRTYLTTRSYHPTLVDAHFISEEIAFWSHTDLSDCKLHFFGSGCLRAEKAAVMKAILEQIGFPNVEVQSDLHGAALALGIQNGWCAICGTGSVAFEMQDGEVAHVNGGYGFEIGDEGSGFYFGKLVVAAIREGNLDYQDIQPLIAPEFDEHNLLQPIIGVQQRNIYAQLPFLLRNQRNTEHIQSIHVANIQLFVERYLTDCMQIGIVGSYGFHHQQLFRKVCGAFGIEVIEFLERPVNRLTDYVLKATDY